MSNPLNIEDFKAYLAAMSDILASGLPNYCGKRIPLPSAFSLPLMTRPKRDGRHVIVDLSYEECSVNNAPDKEFFDGTDFKLTSPSLDNLPALLELGSDAR